MNNNTLKLPCFSYNKTELTPEIINLFNQMATTKVPIVCSLDIIEAAQEGRIDCTRYFNLLGYNNAVIKHSNMHERKKKNVLLNNSDLSEQCEDNTSKMDTYYIDETDKFDISTKNMDMLLARQYIEDNYTDFILYHNIDIFTVLKMSLFGNIRAIEILKNLCTSLKELEDNIITLLSGSDNKTVEWLDKCISERR